MFAGVFGGDRVGVGEPVVAGVLVATGVRVDTGVEVATGDVVVAGVRVLGERVGLGVPVLVDVTLTDTDGVELGVDGGVPLGVADGDAPYDSVALGVGLLVPLTGTPNWLVSAAAVNLTCDGDSAKL